MASTPLLLHVLSNVMTAALARGEERLHVYVRRNLSPCKHACNNVQCRAWLLNSGRELSMLHVSHKFTHLRRDLCISPSGEH